MRGTRRASWLIVCAGLTASMVTVANAANAADATDRSMSALRAAFPHAQVRAFDGTESSIFGAPMNDADSPDLCANEWVKRHAREMGFGNVTLRLREVREIDHGAMHAYDYEQWIDELPVEMSRLTVLVRTSAAPRGYHRPLIHHTIRAAARLLEAPPGGFAPDVIAAHHAVRLVQRDGRYAELGHWTVPQLVVFAGIDEQGGRVPAVHAWKFSAHDHSPPEPRAYTFFVNAATGDLVFARNEICHMDITGNVTGLATPGVRPDVATNPPVPLPVNQVRVEVQGSPTAFAYTDDSGNFTIPWAGTSPVNLIVGGSPGLVGQWCRVDNNAGSEISVTQSATPGTPATIDLHPGATQATTAQINALKHVANSRNYFVGRQSYFTILDLATPSNVVPTANVMQTSTCNAFYSAADDSTNYFASGGGCVNSAYSSVVNHEYGHYVVNERTLAQGAFGEGFSDTVSILIHDDPIIAREFGLAGGPPPGGSIRDVSGTVPSYPCSGGNHDCGQVLGRIVWNIRNNLGLRYGSQQGLEIARDLHVEWATFTNGGVGQNAAHPATADEWLAADDNDGDLSNGTPNYPQIASAFSERGIPLPCVDFRAALSFGGTTFPSLVNTGTTLSATLSAVSNNATIVPGSVMLNYRFGAGAYTSQPIPAGAIPGTYELTLPPIPCGQTISWYVSVQTDQGEVRLPSNVCPANQTQYTPYTVTAVDSFSVSTRTFDTPLFDTGWSEVAPTDGSLWAQPSGRWTCIFNPNGPTPFVPTQDTTPDGSASPMPIRCCQTGRYSSGSADTADVDGGRTILQSPLFDLSAFSTATISYQRWWYSDGSTTDTLRDRFWVEVTNDGGATWREAEALGPSTTTNQWTRSGFTLGALGLAPTSQMRLRFIAMDLGAGSLVEAAIDDVEIVAMSCAQVGCDSIDFNNDGLTPDTLDTEDFLSVFGGGPCSTGNCNDIDFNNDGLTPDTLDIETFIRVFAGGAC